MIGAESTPSRDVVVRPRTGDVLGVKGTMTMMIQDTGATMNASGVLATIQVLFQSNGNVKPVKEISTEFISTQSILSRKENADFTTTKAHKPENVQGIIQEISEYLDSRIRRKSCEWEQKKLEKGQD